MSELPSSPSTQAKLGSHPSSSCTRTRRDWTNLDDGPAGLIAERLLANDVADYVCFRAVCRPWRLCSTDPREHSVLDRRFHPRQWIMLRGTGHRGRRCLINSSTGCSRHVDLPELHGHDVFGPTIEGLLVLLHRATWLVRLLNPLTRQAADLPPATTLPNQNPDLKTPRKVLHVSGAGLADDSTVAVDFDLYGILAVAKPGDGQWTVVCRGPYFLQSLSFADRFYGLTPKAVMVLETSANQPPRLVIAADLPTSLDRTRNYDFHLVDNSGELIFVYRGQGNNDNGDTKYEVYRVSGSTWIRGRWCASTGLVDVLRLSALNMPFLSHLRCSPPLTPIQFTWDLI
jgi:hypothetical protein